MRARAWLWWPLLALVFGCSSKQGECSYDIDCPGICERCNAQHQCYVDTACTDKQQGLCRTDADCDPLQERCNTQTGYCVPRQGEERDGGQDGDGGPSDGGDNVGPDLDYCLELHPDCTKPQSETGTSQGWDRDHDDWGECCDCDDDPRAGGASVNPGRREIIYDCKDNDCNPDTRDDDLDGDGYGSILRGCGPGTDCNDYDAKINPAAAEVCDDKDNNCDGRVDIDSQTGKTVCAPPPCADVSGHYFVTPHCDPYFTEQEQIDIAQDGCNISFTIQSGDNTLFCTGELDPALNLNVLCSGILAVSCTSRVSLGNKWIINCAQGPIACEFEMSRESGVTSCAYFYDTTCVNIGGSCGVICVAGSGILGCVQVNPGGKQPGFYCNAAQGMTCINDFCHDNFCTSPCRNDADCAAFSGTTCQPITYAGCDNPLNINACAPSVAGETTCRRTSDCRPSSGRRCTIRQEQSTVATVCRAPQGSRLLGESCQANTECQSGLCICGTSPCSGGTGKCSEVCMGSSDCPSGAQCGMVNFLDLSGGSHAISVCTWETGGCGRDADCPVDKPLCSIILNNEGTALVTMCDYANTFNPEVTGPNAGEACEDWFDCWSFLCADYWNPTFCINVCTDDGDCPSFDGGKDCPSGDTDCPLDYLCELGRCVRAFRCWDLIFGLPSGGVDAVDVCQPTWRPCTTDLDCREGEACKLENNRDATQSQYFCETAGPGTGRLGESCEGRSGYDACRTGLCIIEGEGGPGKEYCSQACTRDQDCTPDSDPDHDYRCIVISTWLPSGYGRALACARR